MALSSTRSAQGGSAIDPRLLEIVRGQTSQFSGGQQGAGGFSAVFAWRCMAGRPDPQIGFPHKARRPLLVRWHRRDEMPRGPDAVGSPARVADLKRLEQRAQARIAGRLGRFLRWAYSWGADAFADGRRALVTGSAWSGRREAYLVKRSSRIRNDLVVCGQNIQLIGRTGHCGPFFHLGRSCPLLSR